MTISDYLWNNIRNYIKKVLKDVLYIKCDDFKIAPFTSLNGHVPIHTVVGYSRSKIIFASSFNWMEWKGKVVHLLS